MRDACSASTIESQSAGLAEREALSLNTRSERSRYQGFAKRCKADCRADAICGSASWLYEMNAS